MWLAILVLTALWLFGSRGSKSAQVANRSAPPPKSFTPPPETIPEARETACDNVDR